MKPIVLISFLSFLNLPYPIPFPKWHRICFSTHLTIEEYTEETKMIPRRLTNKDSHLTPHALHLTPHGFTLIEIIVILAVISILVAILTPTVLKYIDEARGGRAQSDVTNISAMLNDLIKDTGQFPGDKLAGRTFICGPGTKPTTGVIWCSDTGPNFRELSNHLIINNPDENLTPDSPPGDYRTSGKFRWKGPYLTNLSEDPWGNAYQINASTLVGGNTSVTWVISAGPDASFQTSVSSTSLSGDDVGVRIK